MGAIFLIGCTSSKEVRYHEPIYYDFNLSSVELKPIEPLEPKKYVGFVDDTHLFVTMPTWFYIKMLDTNDLRKRYLKIYKKLYGWALDDVERYNAFVKEQKRKFERLNAQQ